MSEFALSVTLLQHKKLDEVLFFVVIVPSAIIVKRKSEITHASALIESDEPIITWKTTPDETVVKEC